MTEWVYSAEGTADPTVPADHETQRSFSTQVERDADGRWVAVVRLGAGESVSKVFESEPDALRYGDELARWLSARRERD